QTKLGNVILLMLQCLGINDFVNFDNMDSSRLETPRFDEQLNVDTDGINDSTNGMKDFLV
ncbi:unnamed protein product, partial [Rotaria magnacalcarata]